MELFLSLMAGCMLWGRIMLHSIQKNTILSHKAWWQLCGIMGMLLCFRDCKANSVVKYTERPDCNLQETSGLEEDLFSTWTKTQSMQTKPCWNSLITRRVSVLEGWRYSLHLNPTVISTGHLHANLAEIYPKSPSMIVANASKSRMNTYAISYFIIFLSIF